MISSELKSLLDQKADFYNNTWFIKSDPISVPHGFTNKQDIEISAFLVANIAWGKRSTIINNGRKMLSLMGNSPAEFILNFKEPDLKTFENFVHRTFNATDLIYFLNALQHIYKNHGGLEKVFSQEYEKTKDIFDTITLFHNVFFELDHPLRTKKHLSNPAKGSAAKRLNMYLRWMVRNDDRGVDFGIWKTIPMSALMIPLDVHTARLGRKFGLLKRRSNDRKAVEEYTANLRKLNPSDPVKYDFALFGMGAFEGSICN